MRVQVLHVAPLVPPAGEVDHVARETGIEPFAERLPCVGGQFGGDKRADQTMCSRMAAQNSQNVNAHMSSQGKEQFGAH